MKGLRGNIALVCAVGIYTAGVSAYAEPASRGHKDSAITSSMPSFAGMSANKKSVGPEVILLNKPTKENAGQYITLVEPKTVATTKQKKITVKQSFSIKLSPIFNIDNVGLSSVTPSGFPSYGLVMAGNNVTFSYGRNGHSDAGALDISIGSQFLIEPSRIMSPLYDGSEYDHIHDHQVYNLSIDMGYAGFKLGASFSKQRRLSDPGLKGYNFGLGYNGDKWGAGIRYGKYKRERDRLFATTKDFYNSISSLEIGAAYQLFSNIRFTGRFTYYSYGHKNSLDKFRNSQVFFLGTNVNF